MRQQPHIDAPRSVYDSAASAYVRFVGTELNDATEDAIDRAVLVAFVELVRSSQLGPVADLGCGPGRVAGQLARAHLTAVGVDLSSELLTVGQVAHRDVRFVQGRLDELPMADGSLVGAVCWYSIIYTPPDQLDGVLREIARVVAPNGHVLLAFQAGAGEAVVKADAFGTGISLTRYQHDTEATTQHLDQVGFDIRAVTARNPSFRHETSPQAFILARRRGENRG
jgi:ubiquinone/menaquinone biosynthesis C-methylase UbiE